jgi:ferredoxin-NADP reductase
MPEQYRPYTILGRVDEAPGVFTFLLRPAAGERPAFIAGQFVNIALPGYTEVKSYSIASPPRDEHWAVTVRTAGPFSTALAAHKIGDTLSVSEPLGYFYIDPAPAPRLWLAGGIGITPFMSMLRDNAAVLFPTLLYYSNRTAEDVVFKKELERASAQNPVFKMRHFITREPAAADVTEGRIKVEDLKAALTQLPGAQVYLCGSIGFVRDYWSALRKLGVPEGRLFTEAFF